MEGEPAGLVGDDEPRGLSVVQPGRRRERHGGLHQGLLRERPVRQDAGADHAVADAEADHVRPDGQDLAAGLDARRERQFRPNLVLAAAEAARPGSSRAPPAPARGADAVPTSRGATSATRNAADGSPTAATCQAFTAALPRPAWPAAGPCRPATRRARWPGRGSSRPPRDAAARRTRRPAAPATPPRRPPPAPAPGRG